MSFIALVLVVVGCASGAWAEAGERPRAPANDACRSCHAEARDVDQLASSAHAELTCTACHVDVTETPHRNLLVVQRRASADLDGRGTPLAADGRPAPRVGDGLGGAGRVVARTTGASLACASCHADAARASARDVHGAAYLAGRPDAPGCIGCHGDHAIRAVDDPASRVALAQVPATCGASCHAGAWELDRGPEDARGRYQSAPVPTYAASVHGKKLRIGHPEVATCRVCHGAHDVYPASDPRSHLAPSRVAATCASTGCHDGATVAFAASFHHRVGPAEERTLLGRLHQVLGLVAVVVLSASAGDVLLDAWARLRRRLRRRP